MKAILVILLVGTTVAVLPAKASSKDASLKKPVFATSNLAKNRTKCTPKGYCQLNRSDTDKFLGLVNELEPKEHAEIMVEVWRKPIVKGTTYAIWYIKFKKIDRNPMDDEVIDCLMVIVKGLGYDGKETVRVERRPSCYGDTTLAAKVFAKMVGDQYHPPS